MSGSQVPIDEARGGIDEANARMGGKGLRVLAFAARFLGDDELGAMAEDPMSLTHHPALVGMVGIIDPLRTEAKGAVETALGAGIDARMITGTTPSPRARSGRSWGSGRVRSAGPS
jgi:P-type Ca2+ transporter type 2C